MKKKILSLALALVTCLGLAVPAFSAVSDWKMEVPGKSDAEVFAGEKTFILRDCGSFDMEYGTGNIIFYKEDDLQWTARNVCTLDKGDTAVFTCLYETEESTNHNGAHGSTIGSFHFTLIAWSDPDGDGVYDRRAITGDADVFGNEKNGHYDLLPENCFEKVLPVGIDLNNDSFSEWHETGWSTLVNPDEENRYEARLSADRVLEQFGSNTLIWIFDGTHVIGNSPDWAILVEGNSQPTTPTVGGFTDVKTDNWFADPVLWAVSKDITNGTGGGKFSPAQQCTHAQILTFLYRADRGQGKAEAADMDKAVAWAREKGMIDGSFNGKAYCTRADAVSYLWQALGRENATASSFTDVPAGAGYAKAVDWAVANGVTNGTNAAQTEFSPNKVCDRGTIVTFLHRAYVPEARLK